MVMAGWPRGRYQSTAPTDRGSRRGAKRCIVDAAGNILDHATAKAAGVKGEFFQSRHEAKHYVALSVIHRLGHLRPIPGQDRWRQVRFPLYAVRPDGLKEKVCDLVLDFAYEQVGGSILDALKGTRANVWVRHYEDCKPAGGLREDAWLLKKKWFRAQYGIEIAEV